MKPFEVSQKIEVYLSESQQKNITIDYLYSKFHWKSGYFIEDDKLKIKKTYYGSHSWTHDEVLRDATTTDYLLDGILRILNSV